MQILNIPQAFQRIIEPHRCKVFYGGRGSGKSESVARYLLLCGIEKPMNILCCREFQTSIKDSVHQLLADLIEQYEMDEIYTVQNAEIKGKNGTTFIFSGLRNKIMSIKSMHNIKKCWVEEAQTLSAHSLQILFPTIRAEDSELIFTMNPEIEEDPAYQMLIADPPKDSLVQKVNYNDNPYFPKVLRQEMEQMKEKNYEKYLHVWEGNCLAAVEGAIFSKDLQKAQEEGRIGKVPYDKSKPVDVYYDLGRNDKTAMWFVQNIGFEYHLIHYYEKSHEHFSHYIKYCQNLPYTYGTHYLPHDADNEQLSAEKTIRQQAQAVFGKVVIIPRIPQKALAIDAARSITDRCHWDTSCADGLTALRHYAYKVDPETGRVGREPEHDTPWSHGADAFLAIGQSTIAVQRPKIRQERNSFIRRSGVR